MKTVAIDTVLHINDVHVKIKTSTILNGVTFTSCSGDLLAVMGPSGSGKTTILNTIAGRQSITSGEITLSGLQFNKEIRRRLGFVLQQDVFFANLTLWDTLFFTAMIRLPETVTTTEKLSRINEIVDVLDIRKCLHTVIGDMFTRGLSGGEKKRASIACELLTDPDILLLDEPTSGLDSSTAFSLMGNIKEYAAKFNKTVIVSIHQPSSQIYHMFDSLLLLANGQVVYFGGANTDPLNHFSHLGHHCESNYNPADFFLEVLKSEKQIVDGLVDIYNQNNELSIKSENGHESKNGVTNIPKKLTHDDNNKTTTKCASSQSLTTIRYSTGATVTFDDFDTVAIISSARQRWPTRFSTQLKMLTWRNFKQSRGRMLNLYDIIQYATIAAVSGVLFFQIADTPDVFRDRMGLLFFCVTNWTVEAIVNAVLAFPGDRAVTSKERASGSYRLSAYYLAKTISELPLLLLMPTLFYIFVYWMSGLGGVNVFFVTWAILMLSVFTSQGFGLLIGATVMNTKAALVTSNAFILVCLLFSGFITQSVPWWLEWAKYLSIIQYPLSAMSMVTLSTMDSISCNSTSVLNFSKCLQNSTDYVTSVDILNEAGIELPLFCYVSTLAIICVLLRVLAYLGLRWIRTVPR